MRFTFVYSIAYIAVMTNFGEALQLEAQMLPGMPGGGGGGPPASCKAGPGH